MPIPVTEQIRFEVPLLDAATADLERLNRDRKLSLSVDDLKVVQSHFADARREPTDIELEVIAQTWSEHCKHRIFSATIAHTRNGKIETIDGIFPTFVKSVTEKVAVGNPDFVLSAFHDNAGFIALDGEYAACLKVETHNHPSALEPYAGANTGLGGVIRDILGAGKGASPVASLDAFCLGMPDTEPGMIEGDTIHPLGILRGVVAGVRDYGNRMGIPTIAGALHFDPGYRFNPLVFCGTAGIIPVQEIEKQVSPGMLIVLVGGRTGRDGLRGATFSSAALGEESHEEDRGAVQIGNPIEEKKVSNFLLAAREEGLMADITDCGAGGLSSAVGEMVRHSGGHVRLETVPLKESGLSAWEIFLSESQERMVLGAEREHRERLEELAAIYETTCTVIGEVTGRGELEVSFLGETVCQLPCGFLHGAPELNLESAYCEPCREGIPSGFADGRRDSAADLKALLEDSNISSREPIIREYDHEVMGNTVLKPLAGAGGDCPQDGTVVRVGEAGKYLALGVSLLPQYGIVDAYRMGRASVDEAVRQLVVAGADPARIALLDNFCMGNPEDPLELGKLVECARGMSEVAAFYGAPFISGKDSFYNFFETKRGRVSIPLTLLISGLGVIDQTVHITGASLRRRGSRICILGESGSEFGGSALARMEQVDGGAVPAVDPELALRQYVRFYGAVRAGWVLAAHDLSEGGLGIAACEMGFSLKAGIELDIAALPGRETLSPTSALFAESNSRILFEVAPEHLESLETHFSGLPFAVIGTTTEIPRFRIHDAGSHILEEDLP
jgi:phosphoribosylformylglycinamidine synthase